MQGRSAGAVALTLIGWACRALGWALAAITVILCVSGLSARLNMVGLVVDLSRALPAVIAGYGVITTPFGGIFRFDFALIVVALMIVDYVCLRAARMLRTR
ncbi:MAG: hypothetical protein E7001_06155 [Coriobacteriaceae bacterium]|nr:hypothetical protein [Coriobacteriaceae bacterium]